MYICVNYDAHETFRSLGTSVDYDEALQNFIMTQIAKSYAVLLSNLFPSVLLF